jgi:hypothetical protein
VLRELQPWGAQRGQTVTLVMLGDGLTAGSEIFSSVPGTIEEQPAEQTGRLQFKLSIPIDAPLGVYPVRVRTAKGLSYPLHFSVGDLPEMTEAEPNDAFEVTNGSSAGSRAIDSSSTPIQRLVLPVTVNGSASGADQDAFWLSGKQGDRVVAEVEAQRIGSKLDPAIAFYTVGGRELVYVDDTPGLGADCRVDLVLPCDGDYLIAVRDSKFSAGSPGQYRLKIGSFAYAQSVFPLGWRRGQAVDVTWYGGSLSDPVTARVAGAEPSGSNHTLIAPLAAEPHVRLPFRFKLGDEPEIFEPDAGDDRWFREARVLNGQLSSPGEVDRFKFPVKPAQKWTFEVEAAALGSSLDAVLTALDPTGKTLAKADDSVGGPDPSIDVTVPDGVDHVVLVVEDLLGRGGIGFSYRLGARPAAGEFRLRVVSPRVDPFAEAPKTPEPPPVVNIPRGGTALVQVNVVRRSYSGPIQLFVPEELDGITAEGGQIGEGANDGFLFVSAAADAPLRAFDLEIWGQGGPGAKPLKRQARTEQTSPYALADALPARVPAAITEAPPVSISVDQRAMLLVHGQNHSLLLTARRSQSATEAITVSGQGIVAAFVRLEPTTMAQGSDTVTLNLKPIAAPDLVAKNVLLPLVAKTTINGVEETIELAPIQFDLARPFGLERLDSAPVVAPRGKKTRLAIIVRRQAPFQGVVRLAPSAGLPPTVSLAAVDVPKGDSLALLELDIPADVTPGEFDLQIRASANLSDAPEASSYAIPDTVFRVKIPPDSDKSE